MLNTWRSVLSLGLVVTIWSIVFGTARAQFGGVQIQIGGGSFGVATGPLYGIGPYNGGIGVPFGVGPSIPPSSRAYIGPQYQSSYRGYYGAFGVPSTLGVYDSPYLPSPAYRGFGYANTTSLELQRQQYALQRQQMELQAAQRTLARQQYYPYDLQSRSLVQPSRVSPSTDDLRPGMVLPDGATVVSVEPLSQASSSVSRSNLTPNTLKSDAQAPTSSEPKKAAF